jgi:hypothetical protein
MTKAQAKAMNERFVSLTSSNEELSSRVDMLDTLMVKEMDLAKKYKSAYRASRDTLLYVKMQFEISQEALFIQTNRIETLEKELKKKPSFYPVTSTDVWMGTIFSIFGTLIILGQ